MEYFYFNIKQAEISAKIDIEVYNQIRKVDYKYFDTPEFYDSYTLSYGQYAAKSAQTFLQFSSAISLITTISTLVAYILSSTIYVLIVTLVTVVIKVLNNAAPGSESLCRHQKTALASQVRFSVISALRREVFLRSNVRQAGRHSFCGRRQYYRGQIGQYRFCAIENITHGDRHILRHLRMLFFRRGGGARGAFTYPRQSRAASSCKADMRTPPEHT